MRTPRRADPAAPDPAAPDPAASDRDPPDPAAVAADDADVLVDERDEDVSGSVRRGLRWSLGNNLVSRLGTFVAGVVLAHLLAPEDYGEFTVALTVMVILVNVNDLGLETALVRWPGSIEDVAPTAATAIFVLSCGFAGVMAAVAPWAASAMGAPTATGIIQLLALGVVVNGATAVSSAQLTRDFRQDRRLASDLAGFVVGTGLTIWLAATGHGAWSLAWGRLAGNATTSVLHVVMAPGWVRPGWSPPRARELAAIGPPIAGTTLLAVLALNVDYIVVGRVLGPEVLGLYLLAFNLSSWPVNMLSTAVESVAVPGFARYQDDTEALRRAFLRSFAVLMAVALPVALVLSTCAVPLVTIVYGDSWAGAAPVLSILAWLGLARVALHFVADLQIAVGRGHVSLALQGVWLALLVPALTIGAHLAGAEGVAGAHIVVVVAVMLPLTFRSIAWLDVAAGDLWVALRHLVPARGADR